MLSYSFPINEINGITMDLRIIPGIIASLYGGWIGHLFVILSGIILVLLTSKKISLLFLLLSGFLTLFYYWFSPIYLKLRLRLKLLSAGSLAMLVMCLVLWKFQIFSYSWIIGCQFILLVGLGISIIVYVIEFSHNHYLILNQLQRAEKMNVVSHLAASISHEIRNPLTSSRGFLQLMQQESLNDEQRMAYSKIAINELDQAERIIREYLTFAKPAPEKNEHLHIQDELINVISLLTPLANLSNVKIELSTVDGCIIGERSKFQQCLVNLIKNGIESMPMGGSLFIKAIKVKDRILIKIYDQGMGMTTTQLSRLGEPYFSTKVKGTGLGMMVVYRIVESMRGSIQVKSEIGKGTTFSFSFPSINGTKGETPPF